MLFKIGFLPFSIWDLLDILIVGFLFYQIYKLLKGSIAFNIFVGVVMLYILWMVVDALGMDMLKTLLGQFVSVGVLILIIIFQPEVRRFLLFLGNTTLRQRSNFFERIFSKNFNQQEEDHQLEIKKQLQSAIMRMAKSKTGALIILAKDSNLEGIVSGGIPLDAQVSQPLIESIFNKESPLHDGALIISERKIQLASAILPVSEKSDLPKRVGLRHRAAVGLTEKTQVGAFIVSEENGKISFASEGKLISRLSEEELGALLTKWLR